MIGTHIEQKQVPGVDVGVLGSLGNTPMFRLRKMPGPDMAEVWVKEKKGRFG